MKIMKTGNQNKYTDIQSNTYTEQRKNKTKNQCFTESDKIGLLLSCFDFLRKNNT